MIARHSNDPKKDRDITGDVEDLLAEIDRLKGELEILQGCHTSKSTHSIDCSVNQKRKGIWGNHGVQQ